MSVAPHPKKETGHPRHNPVGGRGWLQVYGFNALEEVETVDDVKSVANTPDRVTQNKLKEKQYEYGILPRKRD